jgi:eukaryotic-like serine/threonine-protein kinase
LRFGAFRTGERLYSVAPVIALPPRFRDARRLGHGGMGEIVLATDTVLDRSVAIKLLAERFAEDESIRRRFTREALAAARLSSVPNTVTIFDVGETEQGRPFIVMEYLPGGSLDDRLQHGAVEPDQALVWLGQAARALDAAHAHGIVHRDVKPGNLLLDDDGDVHVADFGVARATDLDSLTAAGTVVGTAGYLSPEQARGESADAASDRYAFGVVAFELLTGERPFQRDTTAAEATAHVHEPVPSIHERNPALPPALDRCFRRALAKDPADRFRSNVEFVGALRNALAEPERTTRVAGPVTAPTRARRQRHPWRAPAIVAVLASLVIVGALLATALTGGDDDSASNTPSVVTQISTKEGERVTVTETTEPPPAPPPAPPPPSSQQPPPPPSSASGRELTDQATNLMRQGRFDAALPIAQQALEKLRGTGQLYEAYANYNVGRSLIELGRCEEGLPYIAASEAIQGSRREFREARAKCGAG